MKRILGLLATVALAAPLPALAQGAGQCVPVARDKIGIQLYTLNKAFFPDRTFGPPPLASQTAAPRPAPPAGQAAAPRPAPAPANVATVDAVLGRLHEIGYRNVESAGHLGLTPAQFKQLLDKHQLKLVGDHDSLSLAGFDQRLADSAVMGLGPYIGSGGYGDPGIESLEATLQTAKNLNELGRKASAKGLKLYAHNHIREFSNKYPYDINKNGRPVATSAWEIIAAETDPRYVNFELDVHWALEAFNNDQAAMLAFIRKYDNRIVLYHIKDTNGPALADLGVGETNWPPVYAAGRNVQYMIFEYDNPPDPLKSAEIAYKYMTCSK